MQYELTTFKGQDFIFFFFFNANFNLGLHTSSPLKGIKL